jgi:hypothetical protein
MLFASIYNMGIRDADKKYELEIQHIKQFPLQHNDSIHYLKEQSYE